MVNKAKMNTDKDSMKTWIQDFAPLIFPRLSTVSR